jgi:hypothetical protein
MSFSYSGFVVSALVRAITAVASRASTTINAAMKRLFVVMNFP